MKIAYANDFDSIIKFAYFEKRNELHFRKNKCIIERNTLIITMLYECIFLTIVLYSRGKNSFPFSKFDQTGNLTNIRMF